VCVCVCVCVVCGVQGRRPCKACAGFNRPNLSCSQCGGWGHLLCPGCGGGRYLEVVAEEAAAGTDAGTHSKGGSSSVVGVPPAAAAVAPMFGGSGSEGEQEAAMAAMEQVRTPSPLWVSAAGCFRVRSRTVRA
jgi:hypothetical protein